MAKKRKENAMRLEQEEIGKVTKKPLVAIVSHSGASGWAVGVEGEDLWQVRVEHADGPGLKGSFGWHLIETCQRALQSHSNSQIKDLKTLLRFAKVRVLNGAPPTSKACDGDPDGVGFKMWEPVLYAAGPTPFEALRVVALILQEKVKDGHLSQMPPLMQVRWARGKTPQEPLPTPWTEEEGGKLDWLSPFELLPPTGRRHVLASLRRQSANPTFYNLHFFGGLEHFRAAFKEAGIFPRPLHGYLRGIQPDFVYVLQSLQCMAEDKALVDKVLTNVLRGIPVLFSNEVEDPDDEFSGWLLKQPTIRLNKEPQHYRFHGDD